MREEIANEHTLSHILTQQKGKKYPLDRNPYQTESIENVRKSILYAIKQNYL